jgi:hypothetical protein
MNTNVDEIEDELVATEGLSQAAVVTDLPNAPPLNKPCLDAEDHTDVPAVDVDIEIVTGPDIVFVDITVDTDVVEVHIDTPHVDTN